MIGLGDLRIYEQWMPGISCSAVRITCKDKPRDTTVEGRKQLVMFLSLDMQSSIADAIRAMLDGMSGEQIVKTIDEQFNVVMFLTALGNNMYDISLCSTYIHKEPNAGNTLCLSTTVDGQILDIVCENMEVSIKDKMSKSKIIAL